MGFLRPYRRQLWGSLAFAWAAMGMTVLIPWLIGRAVNAILNAEGSREERCELWKLHEWGGPFSVGRMVDGLLYR